MTTIDRTDIPILVQGKYALQDLIGLLNTIDEKKAIYSFCRAAITYEEYDEKSCVFERKVIVYADNEYVKSLLLEDTKK